MPTSKPRHQPSQSGRGWMIALALLSIACSVCPQALPTGPRLKDIPSSMKIGAQFPHNGATNATATTVFTREYNCGTVMAYPGDCWSGDNFFNFSTANSDINWLYSHGITINVHMLCGWNLYYWSPILATLKNASPAQLDTYLKQFIQAAITTNSNATKVDVWNVVNEALDGWDGTDGAYRPSDNTVDRACVWNKMGYEADLSGLTGADKIVTQHPVFISKAFEYARQVTDRKLELRDYGIEFGTSRKSKLFYQLVKHLLVKGNLVDVVGFQCHFNVGDGSNGNQNMVNLTAQVKKYKALGLEVIAGELDVPEGSAWNATEADRQKTDYYNIVKTFRTSGGSMVITWGIGDGLDPGWLSGKHPLMFDNGDNPKPAYYGAQQALLDTRNSTGVIAGPVPLAETARSPASANHVRTYDPSGRVVRLAVPASANGNRLRGTTASVRP